MSALNPFKTAKGSPSHFFTVDIGSANCKVLLFEKTPPEEGESGALEVVGSGKVAQGSEDMCFGVPVNVRGVTDALETALEEAQFSLEGVKAKDAFLGLSGEAVSYLTTRMRLTRANSDREITQKELRRIENKAHSAAFVEACKELAARKGRTDSEVAIVNSAITGVEIDGFPATEPVGFKGEKVELSFFNAFAPRDRLLTLESILRSAGLKVQAITSGMYAVLLALLEERGGDDFSGLFIDIGGEKTDVGVVFESAIVTSRTLPLGGQDFTEAVAEKKSISLDDAERRKMSFSREELDDAEVREAVSETAEVWGSAVRTALLEMETVEKLPVEVYLFGGGAELFTLSELLSSPSWVEGLPFHASPQVRVLDPADFTFCAGGEELDSSAWVLSLALGYVGI